MADQFTPPPISSYEGPAASGGPSASFTPPPISAYEGPVEKPSLLDNIGDTIKQWWAKVNPKTQAQGIVSAVTHPIDTLQAYGQQNDKILKSAVDSFHNGDYAEGVRHVLDYAANGVPGIGSELDSAGNKVNARDYKGAIADTAALGTNILVGAKTPEILNAAAEAPAAVGSVSKTAVNKLGEAYNTPLAQNAIGAAETIGGTGMMAHGVLHGDIGSTGFGGMIAARGAKTLQEVRTGTALGNKLAQSGVNPADLINFTQKQWAQKALDLGTDVPSGRAQQIAIDMVRKSAAPKQAALQAEIAARQAAAPPVVSRAVAPIPIQTPPEIVPNPNAQLPSGRVAGPAPPRPAPPARTPMWQGIQQEPAVAEVAAPEPSAVPARTFSGRLTTAQQNALSAEDLAAYREKFPGAQGAIKAATVVPVEDADAVGPAGISLNDLANSNLFGNKKFSELPEVKKMQVRSQKYGFDRAASAKAAEPPAPVSVAGAEPGAQIAVAEGAQGPVQTGIRPQPPAPVPAEPVAQPTAVEPSPEPALAAEAPEGVTPPSTVQASSVVPQGPVPAQPVVPPASVTSDGTRGNAGPASASVQAAGTIVRESQPSGARGKASVPQEDTSGPRGGLLPQDQGKSRMVTSEVSRDERSRSEPSAPSQPGSLDTAISPSRGEPTAYKPYGSSDTSGKSEVPGSDTLVSDQSKVSRNKNSTDVSRIPSENEARIQKIKEDLAEVLTGSRKGGTITPEGEIHPPSKAFEGTYRSKRAQVIAQRLHDAGVTYESAANLKPTSLTPPQWEKILGKDPETGIQYRSPSQETINESRVFLRDLRKDAFTKGTLK